MTLKEQLSSIIDKMYDIKHNCIDPRNDCEFSCPYCGHSLDHWDIYGRMMSHQDGRKMGDIYKCPNEFCESELFNFSFYTVDGEDWLHEGFPC